MNTFSAFRNLPRVRFVKSLISPRALFHQNTPNLAGVSLLSVLGAHWSQRVTGGIAVAVIAGPQMSFSTALPPSVGDPTEIVMKALDEPGVVLIDVRGADEIAQPPHLPKRTPSGAPITVVYAAVKLDDASLMSKEFIAKHGIKPETQLVVFCRTGRRAKVAIDALEKLGCRRLVNGGGIVDMLATLDGMPSA
jgi:3-mercaptopyruvate sulfurtransferase SseA